MDKKKISTGYIVAAAYADKIRRTAFAVFKDVDKDEIVRATSELNKKIYEMLVSMGVDKLDVVRITVDASVEGGKLVFGEPHIELFIPKQKLDECGKRLEEVKTKLRSLLGIEIS